jgi:hypothetical protein
MTNPVDSVMIDFPTTKVSGCSVIREDGTYLAVINSRCGYRKIRQTAEHELGHIEDDDFGKEDADQIERSAHEK